MVTSSLLRYHPQPRGAVVGVGQALIAALVVAACSSAARDRLDGGHPDAAPIIDGSSVVATVDPTTCAEAATSHAYVGCDFWPTITANPVWSIFDFAVVITNGQAVPAAVTVTGPQGFSTTTTVAANSLTKVYLPWVADLKGPDLDACGTFPPFNASVLAPASAYHLVASVPVAVYQFNALEYAGANGGGGPPGKTWDACPGLQICNTTTRQGPALGCFSFSNDASLLLPSTAMTGTYRVATEHGWALGNQSGYFAVTATADHTTVTIEASGTAVIVGGAGVADTAAGGSLTLMMDAGDVAEIVGPSDDVKDLSGSLVRADKPVQVLAGMQCAAEPLYVGDQYPAAACDHLESSVLPAETLGADYVVTVPTSAGGTIVGAKIRMYGNADGTQLTYSPQRPPGCPTTLDAGQVAECVGTMACSYLEFGALGSTYTAMTNCVTESFEVTGTREFAVTAFMLGASITNGGVPDPRGDPSMSPMVTTQQYRTRYTFLAPMDYLESWADVVVPPNVLLTLDGQPVTVPATPLNAAWSILRIPLGPGPDGTGAHVLAGGRPFGAQVIGYGTYTSYQYPAGLNLALISPIP